MSKPEEVSEQIIINEIEDYVGGNIEGVKTVDRMSFTRFLRSTLRKYEASLSAEVASLKEDVEHEKHRADELHGRRIYELEKEVARLREENSKLENRVSLLSVDADRIRKAARTIEISDYEYAEISQWGIEFKSGIPDREDFGEFSWEEIKEALEAIPPAAQKEPGA